MNKYSYNYDNKSNTLNQLDHNGKIVCSMVLSKEDFDKVSFLNWCENMENCAKMSKNQTMWDSYNG